MRLKRDREEHHSLVEKREGKRGSRRRRRRKKRVGEGRALICERVAFIGRWEHVPGMCTCFFSPATNLIKTRGRKWVYTRGLIKPKKSLTTWKIRFYFIFYF